MKGWLQPNASSFAVLIVMWLQLPQLIARQKMASVPISSAYVKQLERNSMSETKAQSNGTELAKYEKNQDIAQERRPFSSCICNVQTMLQSSLQSLPFFSSAPSEQRFKECVDRP